MAVKVYYYRSRDDNRCGRWCVELPDLRRIWVRHSADAIKLVRLLEAAE